MQVSLDGEHAYAPQSRGVPSRGHVVLYGVFQLGDGGQRRSLLGAGRAPCGARPRGEEPRWVHPD